MTYEQFRDLTEAETELIERALAFYHETLTLNLRDFNGVELGPCDKADEIDRLEELNYKHNFIPGFESTADEDD